MPLNTEDEIVARNSVGQEYYGRDGHVSLRHFRWGRTPATEHQRIVISVRDGMNSRTATTAFTLTEAIQLQDALWKYIQEATAAEEAT